MIAYLKGKIIKKTDKGFIINTEPIGYFAYVTKILLTKKEEDEEIELFVHNHIREDCSDLYGFESFRELTFFKKLIGINGIGPKVGLEMLSLDLTKLKGAIINEDATFLSKIPGIGKKTAQRIILELKGKIELEDESTYTPLPAEIDHDIIEALTQLGYQKHRIRHTLSSLPKDITKEEDVIGYFLKNS